MDSAVAYGKADHSKCNLCKEYFSNISHQFLSLAQPGHCEVAGSEESHEIQSLWQPKEGFNGETRNFSNIIDNFQSLSLRTEFVSGGTAINPDLYIFFKLKPPIKGYVRIGNVSHSSGSDVCLLHHVS